MDNRAGKGRARPHRREHRLPLPRARRAPGALAPGATGPIPFRVQLDGRAPGPSHGADVDEDGNGVLRHGRLCQLVRQHNTIRERTLEITFRKPGAQAYAFTFG
jgi:Thioredoxin like C-terminal domain